MFQQFKKYGQFEDELGENGLNFIKNYREACSINTFSKDP